jgi:hypothetical protein
MGTNAMISCKICTTDASVPLGLEIWLDREQIYNNNHVTENVDFSHAYSDSDAEHQLEFMKKNKTTEHTQIDENGTIVKDACLTITDVKFKEVELKQLFLDHSTYTHDFNGTQAPDSHKFFGSMGCNGTVNLTFTTPIYLWLLENM